MISGATLLFALPDGNVNSDDMVGVQREWATYRAGGGGFSLPMLDFDAERELLHVPEGGWDTFLGWLPRDFGVCPRPAFRCWVSREEDRALAARIMRDVHRRAPKP